MSKDANALIQSRAMQSLAYESIMDLRADMKETKDKLLRTRIAAAISQLGKTWDTLEDRKRILKGKPMPGSLRPEGPKTKRKGNGQRLIAQEPEQGETPSDPAQEQPAPKESLSAAPQPEPAAPGGNEPPPPV